MGGKLKSPVPFYNMPGHLIRRLQQVSVALFAQAAGELGVSPVQFAALAWVHAHPQSDQASLARAIAYDPVTIGGVVQRVEAKGWIDRVPCQEDRRSRRLNITSVGEEVLMQMTARIGPTQKHLVEPLSTAEQVQFLALCHKLVRGHAAAGDPAASPEPEEAS